MSFLENVPAALREEPYWLLYRRTPKPGKFTPFGHPKTDKIPLQPKAPYRNASVANPGHVGTFDEALAGLTNGSGADGVGFVVSMADETLIGIDIDGIRDPLLGNVAEHGQAAWELAQKLNTYTEFSPSGEGLRMFVRSRLPRGFTSDHVEVYVGGGPSRFLTVTGDHVPGFPKEIREIDPERLESLLAPFRGKDRVEAPEPPESAQASSGALPKKIPALPEDLPPIESLNLSPHFAEMLQPEGDGDAAFERYDGDRSKAIHAVTRTLALNHHLSPETVLGLLWDSGPIMKTALEHRGQDDGKALQFLWNEVRKVLSYPDVASKRDFRFPDDLPEEDESKSDSPRPRLRVPTRDELQIRIDELESASLVPLVIVAGYLYADLAVRVAPGGVGKTTLSLYETVHIVLGLPLWGREVVTPGWVLIITAEDARERLVARLREIMAALFLSAEQQALVLERIAIWDVSGLGVKLTQDRDGNLVPSELASLIVEAYRDDPPVLIEFDPLVSFGTAESRVNDNEQGLVAAARTLIRGLGCCVRFIHHTGKANAREGTTDQYSARGGTALPDGARMVQTLRLWTPGGKSRPPAGLVPAEDGQIFQIHIGKLSYAPPDAARTIWVQRRGFSFTYTVETTLSPQERLQDDAQQLFLFLSEDMDAGVRHTRKTLEDSSDRVPMARVQIRSALNLLLGQGRVIERDLPPEHRRGGRQKYLHPEAHIVGPTSPHGFGEVGPENALPEEDSDV